ncbi:MAG: hypothetical protein V1822_04510, partial [Candidatus Micrarchaeota archaeon]
ILWQLFCNVLFCGNYFATFYFVAIILQRFILWQLFCKVLFCGNYFATFYFVAIILQSFLRRARARLFFGNYFLKSFGSACLELFFTGFWQCEFIIYQSFLRRLSA